MTFIKMALLRYSEFLRFDRLYLEAGQACQKQGLVPYAFLWYSRYLDIFEAIEDPDVPFNDMLEDAFKITDIVSPANINPNNFPSENLIPEDKKEKISDWVLKQAASGANSGGNGPDLEPTNCLEKRKCDKCGVVVWEGALTCMNCNTTWDMCVVSGFPLVGGDYHTFGDSNEKALNKYWAMYSQVFANNPWTDD